MRHFLLKIIFRIGFNALALYLLIYFLPNISFRGNWKSYLLAGFIFAVINALIKPILRLISFPLIFLTFGLFSIVINMIMLWLLTQLTPDLSITGLATYFWSTMLISLFNFLVNPIINILNRKQEN